MRCAQTSSRWSAGRRTQAADQGRLRGVLRRQDQVAAGLAGRQRRRQDAADGSQVAGEGEFAEEFIATELAPVLSWPEAPSTPRAMGRSKRPPSLGRSAGARLMVTLPDGELEASIEQGAAHPVLALLDRHLRQPDDRQGRQAAGQVDLHGHQGGGASPHGHGC